MSMTDLLLILVPGLPLLLIVPWLRRRIPRCEYMAILPALLLLVLPGDHFVELSWLLFNAGFGSVGETRLLLLMAVLLWLPAAFFLSAERTGTDRYCSDRYSSFFLLTLGGYLAVILATDIVSFFTFSTLMGYGYYGLLVHQASERVKRSGRIYLGFMVVADLLLFEAVLLAASVSEEQSFSAIHEAIAASPLSAMYISIVVLGFALKAGIWPFYFWLPLAFHSARLPAALLLGGVPVAVALLGIVRWLPLGGLVMPSMAVVFLGLGGIAMAFAVLHVMLHRQLATLPAYFTLFATGLFTVALGASLRDPLFWIEFAEVVNLFIVFVGTGAALLAVIGRSFTSENAEQAIKLADSSPWYERSCGLMVRYGYRFGDKVLPQIRAHFLAAVQSCWQLESWKKRLQAGEYVFQHWPFAITLFVLMTIVVIFFSVY